MLDYSHSVGDLFEPLGPVSGEHCNLISAKACCTDQEEGTSTTTDIGHVGFAAESLCHGRRG